MPGNSIAYLEDVSQLMIAKKGINPQVATAAVNGTGLDRTKYDSVLASCTTGAKGGSTAPTSVSTVFKLQESSDNSTFTDVSGATCTVSGENGVGYIQRSLRDLDKYIRLVATPTFDGGSSPSILIGATLNVGGGPNAVVS